MTIPSQAFDIAARQAYHTVDLDRLYLESHMVLDRSFIAQLVRNGQVMTVLDPRCADLVLQLVTYLHGRRHSEEVRYPATWWDHCKQAFLKWFTCPAWLAARVSVREVVVVVDAWEIWGKAPIAPEHTGPTLRVAIRQ